MTDGREERDRIEHAIHGYPPTKQVGGRIIEPKGVEIMGRKGIENKPIEKGVEIIDPRHGHKGSRRSGT